MGAAARGLLRRRGAIGTPCGYGCSNDGRLWAVLEEAGTHVPSLLLHPQTALSCSYSPQ